MALGATTSWEFNPPSYDFGSRPYGSGPGEPHEFTLTNTGETTLIAKNWGYKWADVKPWIELGPPFRVTSSDCRNRTLEPTESCFVDVASDPIRQGHWTGAVMVKSENEEVPIASVSLSGEGTGPALPVSPDHLVIGPVTVGSTSAPQTITLEEKSSYSYRIDEVRFGPWPGQPLSSGPFRITGDTCLELQLEPGRTCSVEVVMTPTEAGTFRAELEFGDVAPGAPQTVVIEGTATAASTAVAEPPVPGSSTAIAPEPGVTTSPTPGDRSCPKGKRKVTRKGRPVCVKMRGRHRHRAHAAKH
jgi:hypothetical protein